MRNKLSLVLALVLMVTAFENAFAHYTFIMPDKFRVAPGETVKIGFHSADSFPDSTQLAKRLTNASLHAAGGPVAISLSEDGKRMIGMVPVSDSGYVAATVINAESIENMKGASFTSYLEEEGLHQIVDARAKQGEADKPARERYTMYAKTLLLAGAPNDAYKRQVGLPIEIVLEQDPSKLKAGESLPVRVLFHGAPASGLELMATSATTKSHSVGKTDAEGKISVPVTSGAWRLHAIYMERSSKPDADWESFWATLTFEVQ